MWFYYPSVLWGLFVLVLPVLIHLFDFRPMKRVYFSHLPMLREVLEMEDRRMRRKLRKRVVLVARLLALAALILCFAQPYVLPSAEISDRAKRVLFYVDNSYSMMRSVAADMSALDVVVHTAKQVVRSYDQATEYFLLSNDPLPLRSYTSEEVLSELTALRYTTRSRSAEALLNRLDPLLRSLPSMDLYWMSDFQAHSFDEEMVVSDTLHRWYVLPVAAVERRNLFIDTAYSRSPAWVRGVPNRLCVRVVNRSQEPCNPCTLRFLVEGTQQALQTTQIEANEASVLCFDYTPGALRSITASVEVDDPRVSFDNTFYMSVVMSDPVNVLEIADPGTKNYIMQVYADTDRFNYQRYSSSALPYDELYTQDLVIVHAVQRLSPALRSALLGALRRGISLVVIPAEEMDLRSYADVLPGLARIDESEVPWQLLSAPDYRLPFYEYVFSEPRVQVSMPHARALYRWSPEDLQSILGFIGDVSFLSYSSAQGHCYLMASPLEESYTDFMYDAVFLPIFYKVATRAQRQIERLYYTPSDREIRVPRQLSSASDPVFVLRSEQNEEDLLAAQLRDRTYVLLMNDRAYDPGFYGLEQDTSLLMNVAFNLAPEESEMNFMDSDELAHHFAEVQKLHLIDEALLQEDSAFAAGLYEPRALWGYFLLATLVFLFVEMAFLRYFWKNGSNH